jgi:hypothetical protein
MTEKEIIKSALHVLANYLETRDIAMSADDFICLQKDSEVDMNPKQKLFVNKLREIAAKY